MRELFALVGKVAVEGIDKSKKDLNELNSTASETASSTGGFFSKLGSMAKVAGAAVVAGVGTASVALIGLGKQSLSAYADYEQLVGGIETLFGTGGKSVEEYAKSVGKSVSDVQGEYDKLSKSQEKALQNANNAWKNQGMSANTYMETITSFSASLIQSLGGDTTKAVEVADLALTDMSDNANKMGTDMELIQNAYQGFSKANFMMLDNLKLGYGGTKEEMQRLLDDAEKIKAANGEMADYSIDSFADMVEAIHVVQENMGITGTTAKEAQSTIQGSAMMMKASWENLLVGMADGTQNLDTLMNNFGSSVGTFVSNLAPRIAQVLESVPKAIMTLLPMLVTTIASFLPSLVNAATELFIGLASVIPSLLGQLADTIIQGLPQFVATAQTMMQSFGQAVQDNLPSVISKGLDMLLGFSQVILENVPILIASGMDLIKNIVVGLMQALPELIAKVPEIITNFANTINHSFPVILQKGVEIIWEIIKGIFQALPTLVANIPKIFQAIIAVWQAINWMKLGKDLIQGIWNGVRNLFGSFKSWTEGVFNSVSTSIGSIFNGIKNTATTIWNAIKSAITNPIQTARNTISSVINGISSTVSSVFNGIRSTTSSVWNGIKSAIETPINKARDLVRGAIDAIKGFFNFKISWPHIPLPHFGISPSGWQIGDLLKGSIPSLAIDWYAEGGILEKPTAFGISPSGALRVGGEAGKEAVAPISELMGYVRAAVAEQTGGMNDTLMKILRLLSQLLPNLNMQVVLDTGVLVGEIAPDMDDELGKIKERKNR